VWDRNFTKVGWIGLDGKRARETKSLLEFGWKRHELALVGFWILLCSSSSFSFEEKVWRIKVKNVQFVDCLCTYVRT
jgi:hypothetical protein